MQPAALQTAQLGLPPLAAGAKPAFSDACSAAAWIGQLQLDNPRACAGLLLGQIKLFLAADIAPGKRLEIIEALRPKIVAVQREQGRRYHGHPAPLPAHQRETLREVCALWETLGQVYQRCLESWAGRSGSPAAAQAQALQRALDSAGRIILEHRYAYILPPAPVYRSLHRLYALAEALALAGHESADPLNGAGPMSARDSYVQALLFDAANPRERRDEVLTRLHGSLAHWAHAVGIQPADLPTPAGTPALFADLSADRGLRPFPEAGPDARVLLTGALSEQIRDGLRALRHGRLPAHFENCAELSRSELETLLITLHRNWCEGAYKRDSERQRVHDLAQVSNGLQAAHFYLSKQPFGQPGMATRAQAGEAPNDPEARQARVQAAAQYLRSSGIAAEQWVVRDESMSGLGLVRPQSETAQPWLRHGLLVAIRRRGGHEALVGTVQWLEETADGDLSIGVRLLPGAPRPVAARQADGEAFFPAILLTPLPALGAPSSLVLPPGAYAPRRCLELAGAGTERIEMTALLESSPDFDRVAFMPAGSVYLPDTLEIAK